MGQGEKRLPNKKTKCQNGCWVLKKEFTSEKDQDAHYEICPHTKSLNQILREAFQQLGENAAYASLVERAKAIAELTCSRVTINEDTVRKASKVALKSLPHDKAKTDFSDDDDQIPKNSRNSRRLGN